MIRFDTTPYESRLIALIVDRAALLKLVSNRIDDPRGDRKDLSMDLSATHSNGNPLDFERLLAADDANFGHDIAGIRACLNRSTGKLEDHFSPRLSIPACPECQRDSKVQVSDPDHYTCRRCHTEILRANPRADDRATFKHLLPPAQ